MLNTIEQKLSAIKAINEEKEYVDRQIERIEAQLIKRSSGCRYQL